MIETICSKCGVKTVEASHCLSLHRDGKDIPLCHPGESYQLEEFGLTMEKAARAGMLHLVKAHVCRRCGAVSYVKSLSLPGELTGVFTLVVLLLTTIFAVFISRNPWWCALVVLAALAPAHGAGLVAKVPVDAAEHRSRFDPDDLLVVDDPQLLPDA